MSFAEIRLQTQTKVDIVEGSKLSTTQQVNIAAGQIEIIESSIKIPLAPASTFGVDLWLTSLSAQLGVKLQNLRLTMISEFVLSLSLPEYRNRLILSSSFSSRNGWPAWTC